MKLNVGPGGAALVHIAGIELGTPVTPLTVLFYFLPLRKGPGGASCQTARRPFPQNEGSPVHLLVAPHRYPGESKICHSGRAKILDEHLSRVWQAGCFIHFCSSLTCHVYLEGEGVVERVNKG